jgi:hypothetical protein
LIGNSDFGVPKCTLFNLSGGSWLLIRYLLYRTYTVK